jgi:hypothetical protein
MMVMVAMSKGFMAQHMLPDNLPAMNEAYPFS